MLFLNISSDQLIIQIKNETIMLERNTIDDTIGPTLVDLYRKYKFSKVFLLNGPGGFTNLRVGTLAVNLLNSLENGAFDCYSISKIDFFRHFIDQGILPHKGIIYIGQRKNVWLYDFDKGDYLTIKKDEINYNDNLFFDLVYEEGYFEHDVVNIICNDDKIILTYNGTNHETDTDELNLQAEKLVDAKYFIKPIMGKQGQLNQSTS